MNTKICFTALLAVSLFQGCSAQKPKIAASAKAENHPKAQVDSTDKASKSGPISKEQIEKWLPKKAGDFTRTSYELDKLDGGKKAEVFLVFEKGDQKMEIAVIDGARSPESVNMTKMAFDMDSQFNKTAESAKEKIAKGEVPHISQVDEKSKKPQIMALFEDRLIVSGVAENMTTDALWESVKALNIPALIE